VTREDEVKEAVRAAAKAKVGVLEAEGPAEATLLASPTKLCWNMDTSSRRSAYGR